ncbi:hypothetical protein HanXRQr2_Chr13g0600631 [Helianthus annuus]|uniref:Uncharacterized protein n=1 Tax=Helianthus annuus TaxID=4232 RepID=A0A9K3EJL8_HELAN|nr:hypothetical protein HanXRQr2_Chr13g0600631 [Helianthus annuus]KAJ0850265.1 hypothetical protein HanPSC8_Chr13g0578641 [Helianthus annuus]
MAGYPRYFGPDHPIFRHFYQIKRVCVLSGISEYAGFDSVKGLVYRASYIWVSLRKEKVYTRLGEGRNCPLMQPERKKKVEFTISRNKQVDNGAEIMEQNHQIMGQKCMKPNHHRKLPGIYRRRRIKTRKKQVYIEEEEEEEE